MPGVLRRVLTEVPECLRHEVAVDDPEQIGRAIDLDRHAVLRMQLLRNVLQQPGEWHCLDPRPLLPGMRAREREQRAREPRETVRLASDVCEEAVALDGSSFAPPATPRPHR